MVLDMVSRRMSVVTRERILARRRLAWAWIALGALLVPLLTLAYSSLTPSSYTATARLTMLTAGPDPLIPPSPVSPRRLHADANALRSFIVAEGAVERLPRPSPNRAAFVQ